MNKDYRNLAYLRRYVDGQLSTSEMYHLERAAHHDEMLMDILLGLEYEKSRDFPLDMADLQCRIQKRVRSHPAPRIVPWTKWGAVASIFLVVVGGGIHWLRSHFSEDLPMEMSVLINQPKVDVPTAQDTLAEEENVLIAMEGAQKVDQVIERGQQHVRPVEAKVRTKAVHADDLRDMPVLARVPRTESKDMMSASTAQRMEGRGPSKRQDSLDVSMSTTQKLAPTDIAWDGLSASSVHGKRTFVHRSLSMDSGKIDPQTKKILNSALDLKEQNSALQVRALEDKIVEIKTGNNYLATTKSNNLFKSPEARLPETSVKSTLLTQDSNVNNLLVRQSMPRGGWNAWDDYVRNKISENNLRSGYVRYQFSLDEHGKAQGIVILKSSDSSSNKFFIELLQNGPIWQVGTDASLVELDVRF